MCSCIIKNDVQRRISREPRCWSNLLEKLKHFFLVGTSSNHEYWFRKWGTDCTEHSQSRNSPFIDHHFNWSISWSPSSPISHPNIEWCFIKVQDRNTLFYQSGKSNRELMYRLNFNSETLLVHVVCSDVPDVVFAIELKQRHSWYSHVLFLLQQEYSLF